MRPPIILFDALHTLVRPRFPIAAVYARAFEPYLKAAGEESLKEGDVKGSFGLGEYL